MEAGVTSRVVALLTSFIWRGGERSGLEPGLSNSRLRVETWPS